MTTDSAAVAYAKAVAGAGALVRDPVDTTLINQVTSLGTFGAVITNESVVGGQPSMTVVTRPAGFDSDGDGIPDTWETAHGLNPNNAADRNLLNPEGYTMVEQYINELGANHGTPTWNGASANWLTPTYWSTGAIPTNNDNAYVVGNGAGSNGLVTVTGTMAQCFSLHIGGNSGPSGDKVTVNGTLAVNDTIYVGDQNNGTLEIDERNRAGLERATGQHRRRHYIYGKPVAKRRHFEDLRGCPRRRHARKLDHRRLLHLVRRHSAGDRHAQLCRPGDYRRGRGNDQLERFCLHGFRRA